jgi:hypothetical protein
MPDTTEKKHHFNPDKTGQDMALLQSRQGSASVQARQDKNFNPDNAGHGITSVQT